jgi:hypothetical protein
MIPTLAQTPPALSHARETIAQDGLSASLRERDNVDHNKTRPARVTPAGPVSAEPIPAVLVPAVPVLAASVPAEPVSAGPVPAEPGDDEMFYRYKVAVERALPRVPVKNGIVEIDSVWVETSLPYDLLEAILRREDLVRPPNVERIVLRTRAQQQPQGEQSGSGKRRRKR